MTRRVLIAGAGIAGQVAAFWLARGGWRCDLVERFDDLRTGGQNVDIRGAARDVIARMGLAEAVDGHGTGEVGTRFVDEADRSVGEFPEDGSAGGGATAEWEILRGQLTTIFREAMDDTRVSYRFNTAIARLDDRPGADAVEVEFDDGSVEHFDAVILAEGVGSRTRTLLAGTFGRVERRSLGVSIAYFSIDRTDSDDQWWRWYNAPGGRAATLRPDNVGRTRVTLSFRAKPLTEHIDNSEKAAEMLRSVFSDAGWECPRILDELDGIDDLYIDDIAQIRADRWSSGRVALVGDAAYCPSPVTGMGTSLAITGAYVLAHALCAESDVQSGLSRYERTLRPYVERAQKLPPGAPGLMHPRSRFGVAALRAAFRLAGSGVLRPFERRLFHPPADTFRVPEWKVAMR